MLLSADTVNIFH